MKFTKIIFEKLLKEKYQQEKKIVEYPTMKTIILLYEDLKKADRQKEKMFVSSAIDSFLKLGIGWNIKHLPDDPEIDDLLGQLEQLALLRRKEATPIYDASFLDKYFTILNNLFPGDKKKSPAFKEYKEIFTALEDMKYILEHPEMVGIYEECQFDTIGQELNFLLNQIKKISKSRWLFTENWFPGIEMEKQACLRNKIYSDEPGLFQAFLNPVESEENIEDEVALKI